MAKLTYYYGTMNSMKSAILLANAFALKKTHRFPLLIGSSIDDRGGSNNIASRIGIEETPDILIKSKDDVSAVVSDYIENSKNDVDIIFIDEVQFFTEQQIDELTNIVDYLGIDIEVYGLKTDFLGHLFPASKRLLEVADSIREVKSTCTFCRSKATLNLRVDENGQAILEGSQVQVGGNESYIAVCREHYKEKQQEAKLELA